jgi:putative lipoic acid-binding regulatory protein
MSIDPFSKPFSCKDKPKIKYPCSWVYKVIGPDESALRRCIEALLGNNNVLVANSHTSSGGKYCSLNVEVVVNDDETRLKYYQLLKNHAAVKVVM